MHSHRTEQQQLVIWIELTRNGSSCQKLLEERKQNHLQPSMKSNVENASCEYIQNIRGTKTHFSTHSSKNQVPAESMWILYLRLFLYTFHFKDRIVRVVHYFVNILADISLGKIMCWCVWNNLWKLSKLLSSLGKWLALSWNNLFPWGYLSWTGEKKTVSVFFRSVCFYFTCHGISQHKLISTSPQLLCGSAVLWICVCLNNWPGPNIGLSQIS